MWVEEPIKSQDIILKTGFNGCYPPQNFLYPDSNLREGSQITLITYFRPYFICDQAIFLAS